MELRHGFSKRERMMCMVWYMNVRIGREQIGVAEEGCQWSEWKE